MYIFIIITVKSVVKPVMYASDIFLSLHFVS